MAENYKHLYEQMKKLVAMYQDEIVPGMREQLAKCVEVVRCKDCKHAVVVIPPLVSEEKLACTKSVNWRAVEQDHFCSYGERREGE